MTATIETRARSYAYGIQIYGCKSERLISYEAGAKEQLAIDIEKAWNWIASLLKTYGIEGCRFWIVEQSNNQ